MLAVVNNFVGTSLEKTLSSFGGVRVSPAQQNTAMESGLECFGSWDVERWYASPGHEFYFGVYEDLGNDHMSRWLARLFDLDNLRIASQRIVSKSSEAWADCVEMALGLCYIQEFAGQYMTSIVTIDLCDMRDRLEASLQWYCRHGHWLINSSTIIVLANRISSHPWQIRPEAERAATTIILSNKTTGGPVQWAFENQEEATAALAADPKGRSDVTSGRPGGEAASAASPSPDQTLSPPTTGRDTPPAKRQQVAEPAWVWLRTTPCYCASGRTIADCTCDRSRVVMSAFTQLTQSALDKMQTEDVDMLPVSGGGSK